MSVSMRVSSTDSGDLFNSKYDATKVLRTGTLVLNMPNETLTADQTTEHTFGVGHKLSFIPMVFPALYLERIDYTDTSLEIRGAGGRQLTPKGVFSPSFTVFSDLTLSCTETQLMARVRRYSLLGGDNFPSATITIYYTLFGNALEEVDYDDLSI